MDSTYDVSTSELEALRLVRALGSVDPERRAHAEGALRDMGSAAIPWLAHALLKGPHFDDESNTKPKNLWDGDVGWIIPPILLTSFIAVFTTGELTLNVNFALLFGIFGFLAWFFRSAHIRSQANENRQWRRERWRRTRNRRTADAAERILIDMDDTAAVMMWLDELHPVYFGEFRITPIVMTNLAKSLHHLDSKDWGQLGEAQGEALYSYLDRKYSARYPEVLTQTLKLIARVNDQSARDKVKDLSWGVTTNAIEEGVQEEAKKCLATLDEARKRTIDGQKLLRPTESSSPESSMLRAADSAISANPEQMLRPSNSTSEQIAG